MNTLRETLSDMSLIERKIVVLLSTMFLAIGSGLVFGMVTKDIIGAAMITFCLGNLWATIWRDWIREPIDEVEFWSRWLRIRGIDPSTGRRDTAI